MRTVPTAVVVDTMREFKTHDQYAEYLPEPSARKFSKENAEKSLVEPVSVAPGFRDTDRT